MRREDTLKAEILERIDANGAYYMPVRTGVITAWERAIDELAAEGRIRMRKGASPYCEWVRKCATAAQGE